MFRNFKKHQNCILLHTFIHNCRKIWVLVKIMLRKNVKNYLSLSHEKRRWRRWWWLELDDIKEHFWSRLSTTIWKKYWNFVNRCCQLKGLRNTDAKADAKTTERIETFALVSAGPLSHTLLTYCDVKKRDRKDWMVKRVSQL